MALDHPAWVEHQRRRFKRPDAYRYVRPDAYRLFAPGAFDALSCRHLERKDWQTQPRVPAGSSDGGQWSDVGGGSSVALRMAGLPRIPGQRPPTTKEQNKITKLVAVALAEAGIAAAKVIGVGSWLYGALPYINAYLDGPKTLGELQALAASPAKGYDIHHIVEQTAAERDGYPRRLIDRDDNLARIPTLKHWEINAWYQTKSEDFGGASPRSYLQGKDWDERRRVGLDALARFGVLSR